MCLLVLVQKVGLNRDSVNCPQLGLHLAESALLCSVTPSQEQGSLLGVEFPREKSCRKGCTGELFWMGLGTLPSAPPQQVPVRRAALWVQGALSWAQQG